MNYFLAPVLVAVLPMFAAAAEPAPAASTAAIRLPWSEYYMQQSALALASGRLDEAKALADKAVQAKAREPRVFFNRATVLLALKDFKGAEEDASKAIALGYEKPAPYNARAEARLALARTQEALADAEKSLALNPDGAYGYFWRARAREAAKAPAAEILADYERAAALDAALTGAFEEARIRFGAAAAATAARAVVVARPDKRPPPLLVLGAAAVLLLLGGILFAFFSKTGRSRHVRFGSVINVAIPADEPRVGAVVGGRYILGRLLEKDGSVEVYEARDLEDQARTVKRLVADDVVLKRAQAAAALKHPAVCALEAAFREGRHVYLAYEPIAGDTLRRLLDRLPQRRLTSEQTLRLVRAVCDALGQAHACGVFHGHLGPWSVLVDKAQVKVRDFGLSPAPGEVDYLAPEESLSAASDLFAWGACLYEALTGEKPFKGPDAAQAKREGRLPPATSFVKGLPEGLDAFFARAMSPEPSRRFPAAAEFFGAYRAVVLPPVH